MNDIRKTRLQIEHDELELKFKELEAELIYTDELMGRLPCNEPELHRVWDEIQAELDSVDKQMYSIGLELEEC